MTFCTLDNHTFEVRDSSVSRQISSRGKKSRAYRGAVRDSRRGKRRSWNLRACFKDHDEGEALVRTINGEGHVVSFVDGWTADTGLSPEIVSLREVEYRSDLGPFDGFPTGSLYGDPSEPVMRYDPQFEADWTVAWWEQDADGDWHVFVMRSDHTMWLDGVLDGTSWEGGLGWKVQVSDGRVTITGNGADPGAFHQLIMLPWTCSSEQVASWTANVKPWGGLPVLRMEGDIIATDHEFVVGEVTDIQYVQKPHTDPDFGWINNAVIIEFTLDEVAEAFVADASVQSQGSIIAPPAPVVPQSGAWAATFTLERESRWAGFAERSDPAPTTIDIVNPGAGIANFYGAFASYDETGQPAFIRTFSCSVSGSTDAELLSFDRLDDGGFAVCGRSNTASTNMDIKDEAGVILGTVTKPAGSQASWGWWAAFSSNGALLWSHATQWTAPPTSGTCNDAPLEILVVAGRLYMAGGFRHLRDGVSVGPTPIYGGMTYPAIAPTLSNYNSGAYIVELDTATGLALNLVANDNYSGTNANGTNVWFFSPPDITASSMVANPAETHIHFSFAYCGRRQNNMGHVIIGRNKAGSFSTRVFSSSGNSTAEFPICAKFDLDLNPVQAVTFSDADILNTNITDRTYLGTPAVGSSKIALPWSFSSSSSKTTPDLDRNPTPYASHAPGVLSSSGNLNLVSIPESDYGDPRIDGFSVGLASTTTAVNGQAKMAHLTFGKNETKIICVARSLSGNFSDLSSFLGGAAVDWEIRQSWMIAIDPATGAEVWKNRLSSPDTALTERALIARQFENGPQDGKIYSLSSCGRSSTANVTPYGAHNASDDAVAYDIDGTWPDLIFASNRQTFFMGVWDDDGEVIPGDCYPVMGTQWTAGMTITEFRIF